MPTPAVGVGADRAHPASQPSSGRSRDYPDPVRSVLTGALVSEVDSRLLGKVVAADLTPEAHNSVIDFAWRRSPFDVSGPIRVRSAQTCFRTGCDLADLDR